MRVVSEYIFSVCGAALVCTVLKPFLKKGTAAGVGKLVTGVFLLLTVLHPLKGLAVPLLDGFTADYRTEAQQAVFSGEESTYRALAAFIKDRSAAYILQKADAVGLQLEVEVVVSGDTLPVPQKVYITGAAAPYARQQLQEIIRRELGIAKENQIWT